jgi:hypothetical protein
VAEDSLNQKQLGLIADPPTRGLSTWSTLSKHGREILLERDTIAGCTESTYTRQRDTAGERHHSRMYREYTWQRDTAGERHHSRMYREYTWQRDTAGERHHSRMYREYTWQRDTAGRSQSIQTVLLTEHIAHLQRRGPYLV